jgi:hypothetical protein
MSVLLGFCREPESLVLICNSDRCARYNTARWIRHNARDRAAVHLRGRYAGSQKSAQQDERRLENQLFELSHFLSPYDA